MQGLRTLVVGTKVLDADWFADWDERYEAAKGSLNQRDEQLSALAREIEQDLELVGATAIEDKLQAGAQLTALSCQTMHGRAAVCSGARD